MSFVWSRWQAVVVLFALTFAATYEASLGMFTLWLTTDTYMHGLFVLPLAFILAKSRPWPERDSSPLSPLLSAILCFSWAGVILFGKLAMINVIQQAMLIALIPLLVITCYGWRIAKHYAAPLLLCFLCVPVGDFMIPYLQSITADMSVFFLQLNNVPVLRNGWYISIPAADFRVAEACSGINFLISTFTLSIFYAFLYMEKTYKRVAFILIGFVVPIISNGLRVYLIIKIADMGYVEAATGFDHLVYGWVFFVFILIALFVIGNWMQDPDPEKCEGGVQLDMTPLKNKKIILFITLSLSLSIAYSFFVETKKHEAKVSEISGTPLYENDILGPQFPAADSVTYSGLESGWRFYEIIYASEFTDKKIIGYQNRWFNGKVWSVDSKGFVDIDGETMNLWTLADLRGRKYHLIFSYCVGGNWSSSSLETKLNQFTSKLKMTDLGGRAYAWFGSKNIKTNDIDLFGLCNKQGI